MYYTLTKDFKTFADTELLFDPGFNVIDATIEKVDDGYLMFLKDETVVPEQKNIKMAYSETLNGPYSTLGLPITGDYWAEGPTSLKVDGKWIVYFDKYVDKEYGAVQSTDLKKWEDISGQINFPKGARHGTVFKVPRGLLSQLKTIK